MRYIYGLAEKPWSTEWRGISPPLLLFNKSKEGVLFIMAEKILSVFIDESGDFGAYDYHTPFYLITMILHNQSIDITENIRSLEQHVQNLGYGQHAIHTGPLIRRESVYSHELMENRKKLFNALFNFSRKLDFRYLCAVIKKSECPDIITMTARLSRSIADTLRDHLTYMESFEHIIVYYDNGQLELTRILTSVFNALFFHVEFRKVKPIDYKLFQVADLICTMRLLSKKAESNSFSRSETEFFGSVRDFKKNYWKILSKKQL